MSSAAPIPEQDADRAAGWYPSHYLDRSGNVTVMFWDGKVWGPFAYRANRAGTKPRPRDWFGLISFSLTGLGVLANVLSPAISVEAAWYIWMLSILVFLTSGVLGIVGARRAKAAHYRASLSIFAALIALIIFAAAAGFFVFLMVMLSQL